jgi:hypothetical protein
LAANRIRGGLNSRRVAINERNLRAFPAEDSTGGRPNSATAAGYDRDLACESLISQSGLL